MKETVPEEKVIEFNADDKAVILKTAADLYHSMSWFHENVTKGRLTDETLKTSLSIAEFRLSDLAKKTGYQSKLSKEIDARYAEIRKLNERVRTLEDQLASGSDTATLTHKLRRMGDIIKAWYRKDGFGHVSEITFCDWGSARCKFSGMLCLRDHHFNSDTPETDKQTYEQWLQNLIDSGWDLYFQEGKRDVYLIDNTNNQNRIKGLFAGRFPTAAITDFHSHVSYVDHETVYIRDIDVIIRDFTEIDAGE